MAPPTRTPRTKWIDEGLRALAAGGPDAVRIEALAKSLGVTKGGFYGHFQDRKALLDAMLDTWERRTTDDVLARVEQEGGDARTNIRRAGELTFSVGGGLRGIDLAVRDWSDAIPPSPSGCATSTTDGWTTYACSWDLLPGRRRRRGALHARLLAPDR